MTPITMTYKTTHPMKTFEVIESATLHVTAIIETNDILKAIAAWYAQNATSIDTHYYRLAIT